MRRLDAFLNAFVSGLGRRRVTVGKESPFFQDFGPRPPRLRQHLIFEAFKMRLLRENKGVPAVRGAPSHLAPTLFGRRPVAVEIDRVVDHRGIPPIPRWKANDPPDTARAVYLAPALPNRVSAPALHRDKQLGPRAPRSSSARILTLAQGPAGRAYRPGLSLCAGGRPPFLPHDGLVMFVMPDFCRAQHYLSANT